LPLDVEPTELVVDAAAEPQPALKWRLHFTRREMRPGNAALGYALAATRLQTIWSVEQSRELYALQELWHELPLERAKNLLTQVEPILAEVEAAARCDDCDWQFPIHDRSVPDLRHLPLQQFREFGRLLQLKARICYLEHRFDEAISVLRTGLTLARHVCAAPDTLHVLVGLSLASVMAGEALDLAQQPGAPNLYAALAALPWPFCDVRPAIDAVADLPFVVCPELADLSGARMEAEDSRRLLKEVFELLYPDRVGPRFWRERFEFELSAIQDYPDTMTRLVDRGYVRDDLEGMPAAQVLLVDAVNAYVSARDDLQKVMGFDYWEFAPLYEVVQNRLEEHLRSNEAARLVNELLASCHHLQFASAQTGRRLSVLRQVEQLRQYAALHDGRWPASLAETGWPVEIDPMHGKPFDYRLEGNTAILSAMNWGVRYDIRIRE
jgi:hypothetical protein